MSQTKAQLIDPVDLSIVTADLADDAVTAAKLASNAVVNASVDASAAIAGSKISPNFGSQDITTTGNLNAKDIVLTDTVPLIVFNDSDNENDFAIGNINGTFVIQDQDGGPVQRFSVASNGQTTISGNLDCGAGLDVTGAITATGDITLTNTQPKIVFNDSNNNPDYQIENVQGVFKIRDNTNSADRLVVNTDGHIDINGNLDCLAGLDVTGAITGTGDLTLSSGGANRLQMTSPGAGLFLIKNPSAAGLAFGTNNVEKMRITAGGNVGIGTTSPARNLEVKGASGDPVHFKLEGDPSDYARIMFADGTDDNIGEIRYNFGSDFMSFTANAAERMRIDSSGRVMIGTTSPGAVLTLDNTGQTTQTIIQCEDTGGSGAHSHLAFKNTTGDVGSIVTTGDNLELRVDDATVFSDLSGGEHMRIDSSGRLGIGTTNPASDLHIESSSPGLRLSDTGNSSAFCLFDGNGANLNIHADKGNTVSNTTMGFAVDNSVKMLIDSSGRVGIGTTNIGAYNGGFNNFVIRGSGNTGMTISTDDNSFGQIAFSNAEDAHVSGAIQYRNSDNILELRAGESNGAVIFSTVSNTERMRIDSSGNVGIGTSSASSKLNVHGGNLTVRNDTNGQAIHQFQNRATTSGSSAMTNELHFNFARTGTPTMNLSGARIVAGKEREWVGAAGNQDGFLAFHTCFNETPAERVRIGASGHFLIGTTTLGNTHAYFQKESSSRAILHLGSSATSALNVARFKNSNGTVGNITTSGTSTQFNTTNSDRTLKKNFESWNENVLNLFKDINPQKFNFIQEDDGTTKSKGFIAQDMVSSFPEAYTKAEEEEDAKYFFNPSGMVVYLMKAIQELEAKVAELGSA